MLDLDRRAGWRPAPAHRPSRRPRPLRPVRPPRALTAALAALLLTTCAPRGATSAAPAPAPPPAVAPAPDPVSGNALAGSLSPYLLQHATNPVAWRPWGDAAFAAARARDLPVFLSIGYATCHWCHVMAHESFEDPEIAAFLNAHFIPIKVDREQRPDVDAVYLDVVQRLTGRAGWPLTVVLTPDREPFFGATYIPPRDGARGAREGLLTVLHRLADAWEHDRAALVARAAAASRAARAAALPAPPGELPTGAALLRVVESAARGYDPDFGGFGRGVKFPRPALLELLLRVARRAGDARARTMALVTLRHIAAGGIRDHVGGGFHRYATDRRWRVPHFEKMLYDQALLARVYLDAARLSADPAFAEVARDTLAYVERDLRAPGGAFIAATDADSLDPAGHEAEGWYFTWTPAELEAALGPADAEVAAAWYGVSAGGDLDGRSVLRVERPAEAVATQLGLTPEALRARVTTIRARLLAARAERPAPAADGAVLAGWNGLAISAFSRAAVALDDPALARVAERAAGWLLANLVDDTGRLHRSGRDGRVAGEGFLDDYAYLIEGLLDLFEATAAPRWLDAAKALQSGLDARFRDRATGAYFQSGDDHERLLARALPAEDGALPSGNAVAATNLLRLAELTGDDALRARGERAIAAFSGLLDAAPTAAPALAAAVDRARDVALEVIIVSPSGDDAGGAALRAAFRRAWLPNAYGLALTPAEVDAVARDVPAVLGKGLRDGRATAYVCERGRCNAPTTDPAELARELAVVRPLVAPDAPAAP